MASKTIIDVINGWNEKNPEAARPAGLAVELDDEGNIKCPRCGESYGMHMRVKTAVPTDDGIAFFALCECGTSCTINVTDHEGFVYLSAHDFREAVR